MVQRYIFAVLIWLAILCQSAVAVEVQWFGHSTTRIVSNTGKVIVIDPFFRKNPKTPPQYRDLEALGPVDLILITHGHGDHVGDLLELVRLTGATVVGSFELIINMIALGLLDGDATIAMNKGGAVQPFGRDVTIHMVPAEHSSSVDLRALGVQDRNPLGSRFVAGGEPAGYVIELDDGFTIYHSGDTHLFGDMRLIGEFHKPDLALVSMGGYYTMGPEQAAYAVNEFLKPKRVLPIHFGTFPLINRTPDELREALGDSDVEFIDLQPGGILRY